MTIVSVLYGVNHMNWKARLSQSTPFVAISLLLISLFIPAFWVIVPQYGIAEKVSLWDGFRPLSVTLLLSIAPLVALPLLLRKRRCWLMPLIASLIGAASFLFMAVHNISVRGFQFTPAVVFASLLFVAAAIGEAVYIKSDGVQ